MRYVLFTDNLADLSVAGACDAAKAAGFDGLDLTLRPGGHVRPEDAEAGLAEARRTADRAGVDIPLVSTAITDVDSPHAEAIFAAAAHYGARRLKLGYWEYRPFGTLADQVEQARQKLRRVVALGRKYHVCRASTATPGGSSPRAARCCTWSCGASSRARSAPTSTRCT